MVSDARDGLADNESIHKHTNTQIPQRIHVQAVTLPSMHSLELSGAFAARGTLLLPEHAVAHVRQSSDGVWAQPAS